MANVSKDSVRIHLCVERNYFSYNYHEAPAPELVTYTADAKLVVEIYKPDDLNRPVETYEFSLTDTLDAAEFAALPSNVVYSRSVAVPWGAQYVVKLELADINSDTRGFGLHTLDRRDGVPMFDLFLKEGGKKIPVFDNVLFSGKSYSLETAAREWNVTLYPGDTTMPLAPFIQKPAAAPKVPKPSAPSFKINAKDFSIAQRGVTAAFQAVDAKTNPVYFFVAPAELTAPTWTPNPVDMIGAMAYIATPAEMKTLNAAKNPLKELESLWNTLNAAKTESLHMIYYNRAAHANRYFTTIDKEGWQTDKGMAFIVLGQPDAVTLREQGEYWFYEKSPEAPDLPLQLYFQKIEHPFAGYSYVLDRKSTYQKSWQAILGKWRKGQIVNE
jgi:GWxTD domain-containing protein